MIKIQTNIFNKTSQTFSNQRYINNQIVLYCMKVIVSSR